MNIDNKVIKLEFGGLYKEMAKYRNMMDGDYIAIKDLRQLAIEWLREDIIWFIFNQPKALYLTVEEAWERLDEVVKDHFKERMKRFGLTVEEVV